MQAGKRIAVGLAALLLAAILGAAIGFAVSPAFRTNVLSLLHLSKAPKAPLPGYREGTLYLSLIPDSGTMPLGIYSYDVANKRLGRVLVDPSLSIPDYTAYISPSLSSDGATLAFASKKHNDPAFQIYTARPDGTDMKQITKGPEALKREPVISPLGSAIAYVALRGATTTDPELPDNWDVYLTDLSGHAAKIAQGVNPLFSPDGTKLLILKNDGLHLYDITNVTHAKEIGLVARAVGGRASQTMKLALSRDGALLAWSSPGKENVIITKITSWDPFSLAPFKTLPVKAYWSVFSPDDRYLALQQIKVSSRTGLEYAVVSMFDLGSEATSTLPSVLNLYQYVNEYMWLGGWAK